MSTSPLAGIRPAEKLISILWGFVEATVFFIVPDIYLGHIALTHYRRALFACLYCVAGAVIGGALVYEFSALDPIVAQASLERIPAVSAEMFARARDLLADGLFLGLIEGAFTGVPYKVFAASAGELALGLVPFLILSFPARLLRFVLIVSITSLFSLVLLRELELKTRRLIYFGVWAFFYALFFAFVAS